MPRRELIDWILNWRSYLSSNPRSDPPSWFHNLIEFRRPRRGRADPRSDPPSWFWILIDFPRIPASRRFNPRSAGPIWFRGVWFRDFPGALRAPDLRETQGSIIYKGLGQKSGFFSPARFARRSLNPRSDPPNWFWILIEFLQICQLGSDPPLFSVIWILFY